MDTRWLIRRNARCQNQANAKARPNDGIGEDADAKIGEDQDDDKAAEDEPLEGGESDIEGVVGQEKECAGQELDDGVHGRDRKGAIATFAAKPEPAEDGHVVVGLDGGFAAWAAGAWGNYGFAFGNAGDTNIQEAADDDAKEEKEEGDHWIDFDTVTAVAQRVGMIVVSDG